jgi:hypothetical protein
MLKWTVAPIRPAESANNPVMLCRLKYFLCHTTRIGLAEMSTPESRNQETRIGARLPRALAYLPPYATARVEFSEHSAP